MEANSLATVRLHLEHFEKTLGKRFSIRDLTMADLQRHINERRKKKHRGKPLSAITLPKEMATHRACWNWGVVAELVSGSFPSKGLVYRKTDEKPPFMTRAKIERRTVPSLTEAEKGELWDCLYLTQEELPICLQ
jgi:integrase